jgi:hypothetical protein
MLSQTVYSLGNPGTLDITDKNDPQYYIARFSHEMSQNYYNLQQAGFAFYQMETSDYSAFEDAFDTYRTTLATWFDTAVTECEAGDPISAVPAIPDITTIVPWLGANPWVTFLVRVAIDVAIRWLRQKLDPDTDSLEIARVLRQALIGESGGDEFSLIELLANVPIEVLISKFGEIQNILVASRGV